MTIKQESVTRKVYSAPVVQMYGDLAELTRQNNQGSGANDGGSGQSTKNTSA